MKVDLFEDNIRRLKQITIPIQSIRVSEIFESNKYYHLERNQIIALQSDVFSNQHCFKNVLYLDLSDNLLSSIDCNVFY